MKEIKCPKCGEVFQVDESGYAAIVQQVRDREFEKQIKEREASFKAEKDAELKAAVLRAQSEKSSEMDRLKEELINARADKKLAVADKDTEIERLKGELETGKKASELAVKIAVQEKDSEILKLKSELELQKRDREINENALVSRYKQELALKDEVIEQYKDFKLRQSTKMIGESLEQHCEMEFNKLRATGFPSAYFEKDNDARTGSKGDYIYRESVDGIEFISIMFEMKNEADETATKHKNEDFFKELDKDRNEKGCEYAILVSMLEADNELYNTGIVDVSHRYPKMYVIRPQFFIPIISLLRNASLNSINDKRELQEIKTRNIDITNFENALLDFKDKFSRNYELASKHFDNAITEIDKSIDHLQKIKKELQASKDQLRLANNKADDLTIKRLTKNSPSVAELFEK